MGNCFAKDESVGGAEVTLHVYDVSGSDRVVKANNILKKFGTGAFHAAVEVYGREWSFGKTRVGCGIFPCEPRHCTMHQYRQAVPMGRTQLREPSVLRLLEELAPLWPGDAYDLLNNNCTHFSNEFCKRLGVGPIPQWVTNLGTAGATIQQGGRMIKRVAMAPMNLAVGQAHKLEAGFGHLIRAGKERRGTDPYDAYRVGDVTQGIVLTGKEQRGDDPWGRTHFRDLVHGAAAAARGRWPNPAAVHSTPQHHYRGDFARVAPSHLHAHDARHAYHQGF